jgi:hypothetical protein
MGANGKSPTKACSDGRHGGYGCHDGHICTRADGIRTLKTNFRVTTTGVLVRLCEAAPTDATGIATLHLCHGFAVGAYQYHQITTAENKPPLFREPNPPPSRNEAIAGFISWTRQSPSAMSAPPVEGMFRYLAQSYPCRH